MLEKLNVLSKAWYLGNTTIRSPYRIKNALEVLSNSSLLGSLSGHDNENAFAKLLHKTNVVTISRLENDLNADVSDLGRKWRAGLVQLGFLIPDQKTLDKLGIKEKAFTITANGKRLIDSTSLLSAQECFLRALLAQQIPSPIERFPSDNKFNPLTVVLNLLSVLEKNNLEPIIKINEMASIVELIGNIQDIKSIITTIANYRAEESLLKGRDRKRFQRSICEEAASKITSQNADTLSDYADTNFRYLKMTGLFSQKGHGICIAPHKKSLINQILNSPFNIYPDAEYINKIWEGAVLPSDDQLNAISEIHDLYDLLSVTGYHKPLANLNNLQIQDLSQIRIMLEEEWQKIQEKNHAKEQASNWKEIVEYFQEFSKKNSSLIPKGEAPAYLEWIFWRAFLAIDSLKNSPWDARRFNIDQDFLPISTASGNGPDMIFEFEDFIIVVEVTLTTSSRQEAAEGEPVRRHVADYVDKYKDKIVYGLFIANQINTNTAETFRIGVWYRNDDSQLAVWIVPITIDQFSKLFESNFSKYGKFDINIINQLLLRCRAESNMPAPEWKKRISKHVDHIIKEP